MSHFHHDIRVTKAFEASKGKPGQKVNMEILVNQELKGPRAREALQVPLDHPAEPRLLPSILSRDFPLHPEPSVWESQVGNLLDVIDEIFKRLLGSICIPSYHRTADESNNKRYCGFTILPFGHYGS